VRQPLAVTLDQVAADNWLQPLAPEVIPALAVRMLLDGFDSPALRPAAPLTNRHRRRPRYPRPFPPARNELGAWIPDHPGAQVRASVSAVRALLADQISITECAARLRAIYHFDDVIHKALPSTSTSSP
jgi:hypothetical protein